MISRDSIEAFAKKYQTSEQNVLREYFQHLFLSSFYQQEGMKNVHFKGGTALRLVYHSPRFSEDLDFESPLADIHQIESAIIATLAKIQTEGIEAELDEAKETSGGYLSTMRFLAFEKKIPIRIEISFRNRKSMGAMTIVTSDLFPDYSITQLAEEQLLAGKIAALLDRKKPRDFYDFYFILRHNLLPEKNKGTILRQTLENLQSSSLRFESELKEFLPKSHHMIIRDFKKTLTQEIKHYL
jgi:predicted nucleotidyltransferase component of viral defense system